VFKSDCKHATSCPFEPTVKFLVNATPAHVPVVTAGVAELPVKAVNWEDNPVSNVNKSDALHADVLVKLHPAVKANALTGATTATKVNPTMAVIIVLFILIFVLIFCCSHLIEYKYLIRQEFIIKFFISRRSTVICTRILLATLRTNHELIAKQRLIK